MNASCSFRLLCGDTHCTKPKKDRRDAVEERVLLAAFLFQMQKIPHKNKPTNPSSKLSLCEHSPPSLALLCWQSETSKASRVKIHCSTHTEGAASKQTLSVFCRRRKNHFMQHTEPGNLFSLFNYVSEALAQGAGAVFCIPPFCLPTLISA